MVDKYNFNIAVSGEGIWPTPISFYNDELMPISSIPTFNPPAGTYSGTQNVTISSDIEGATIFYTIDGSTPTVDSTVYTGPVTVSTNTTIKAIAVLAGYGQSAVATAAYVLYTEVFDNLDNWDTGGSPTVGENGLDLTVGAGGGKWARSKWYLTGDFVIEGKVTITDRSAGRSHWTSMWISRESDNVCFAASRNTWDSTSGWSPQWRGWDSCSPVTSMGIAGTTTVAGIGISRIVRIGSTIYTYVKHSLQAGWPESSWILTGQDNSFTSGVPGNANCHITLGTQSNAPDNPTATVHWEYLNVVSGTIVTP